MFTVLLEFLFYASFWFLVVRSFFYHFGHIAWIWMACHAVLQMIRVMFSVSIFFSLSLSFVPFTPYPSLLWLLMGVIVSCLGRVGVCKEEKSTSTVVKLFLQILSLALSLWYGVATKNEGVILVSFGVLGFSCVGGEICIVVVTTSFFFFCCFIVIDNVSFIIFLFHIFLCLSFVLLLFLLLQIDTFFPGHIFIIHEQTDR